MEDNFMKDHINHDQKWVYSSDSMTACIACIVQTIEDPGISRLKKTPTVATLSRILVLPEVVRDLRTSPTVSCHIIHILLEALLQTDETTFITSSADVCLKLIQSLESEDIVDFILQDVENKIESILNHKDCLPLYVLLGRMVQKFPELAEKFLQQYEHLIAKFCISLSFPDEDVQSAAMFILVYIFEGCWENRLSPRQLTQLCEDLVCVLNTAKTQILMMNSLGLLTKLMSSDQWLRLLMTMTINGVNLLTVLKKIIASNMEVVQQLAIQVLSNIVLRDNKQEYCFQILQTDLLEFLFEKLNTRNTQNIDHIFQCLKPLCQMEVFYTRNHSLYGIEILLKTLHTVNSMNHYNLTKKILEIITIIFDRQPTKSALFVNSTTLKFCLDVISSLVDHSHPGVLLGSIQLARAFFRKEHMLRPVPVSDLKSILEKMTTKVQTFVFETELFEKERSKVNLISKAYCEAVLAAGRLVLECKKDPSTCMSAFLAPDVEDNKGSTIESMAEDVVMVMTQKAVPLAVNLLDDKDSCTLLFQILNCLQKLDVSEHRLTILQLTKDGLLLKVVAVRCCYSNSHKELQIIDPCLMSWCIILYQNENKDDSCFDQLELNLENVSVPINELAGHLTHTSVSKETTYMYSFLLYHCYKNNHMVIPSDELMFILETFSKEFENFIDLSPLTRKLFVFLWAMVTCLTENVIDLPEKGLQTALRLIDGCPTSIWYTHHPAILHWAFKDSRVVRLCGLQVLQHWLDGISESDIDHADSMDVAELYLLFSDEEFMSVLLESIAGMNSKVSTLTIELMENYIAKLTDSDEQGIFLLKLTAITEERIVQLFLDPSQKPEDLNVECYIQLLMLCENRNTDDISSSFLKILYHILSWLDDSQRESVITACLHLLSGAMHCSPFRVVNLMVNSYKFMGLLNKLLTSERHDLVNSSWNILSLIINNMGQSDDKAMRIIELAVSPVENFVHNIKTITSYLQVVSALLKADFMCSVVTLKNTGRFPAHMPCPFTSKDFKVLFIYLQQFVLQDVNDIKTEAVNCIEHLLRYLKKYAPDLGANLLRCSWNSLLFEVIITITASDLSSLHSTLQLIKVILDVDDDGIIFKRGSDLNQHLVDFLSCVDDVEHQELLNHLKNKVL